METTPPSLTAALFAPMATGQRLREGNNRQRTSRASRNSEAQIPPNLPPSVATPKVHAVAEFFGGK